MRAEATISVQRFGKRKVIRQPRQPVSPRIPRISRLITLAIKMQGMVDSGEVRDDSGSFAVPEAREWERWRNAQGAAASVLAK